MLNMYKTHRGSKMKVIKDHLILSLWFALWWPNSFRIFIHVRGGTQDTLEKGGYPLQYSGLENSMDCIVHGAANGQTGLSNFHFYYSQRIHTLMRMGVQFRDVGRNSYCSRYSKRTSSSWLLIVKGENLQTDYSTQQN